MFECFLAEGKKIGVLFVVVFRGKVSEGMDFVDNYVRVVIIVRYNGFSENLNLLYYSKGKIVNNVFKNDSLNFRRFSDYFLKFV